MYFLSLGLKGLKGLLLHQLMHLLPVSGSSPGVVPGPPWWPWRRLGYPAYRWARPPARSVWTGPAPCGPGPRRPPGVLPPSGTRLCICRGRLPMNWSPATNTDWESGRCTAHSLPTGSPQALHFVFLGMQRARKSWDELWKDAGGGEGLFWTRSSSSRALLFKPSGEFVGRLHSSLMRKWINWKLVPQYWGEGEEVWRTWLFIAYSDERWSYYQFSPPQISLSIYPSIHLCGCSYLNLSTPKSAWSISNFPLQPHQKYYITQYEELGSSWLTQMKDDYTVLPIRTTWECTFWTWESERLKLCTALPVNQTRPPAASLGQSENLQSLRPARAIH